MIFRRTLLVTSITVAALLGGVSGTESADAAERWRSPRAGAVVASPPLLRWRPVRGAVFYNVQLYRNQRKVLTRWPRRARFRVTSRWVHRGRTYRLRAGRYRWYVWPAYESGYGRLRVRSGFKVARRPTSVSPPVVVGEGREGAVLTARSGVWRGYPRPRLSHAWRRCHPDRSCVALPAARARLYRVAVGDIDASLQVVVTARNAAGSATAVSATIGPILPAPPENVSSPWIAGASQIGALVVAANGSWTSSRPVGYSFQWLRCVRGECSAIHGATRQAYAIRRSDFLGRLRVVVTGKNGGGSTSAVSAASDRIGRRVVGTQDADHVRGSFGSDFVRALASDDVVRARAGADRVHGGRGRDHLFGGAGSDRLVGGADTDVLDGGPGADVIGARDHVRDHVICGHGVDRVLADRRDRVSSKCELVARA